MASSGPDSDAFGIRTSSSLADVLNWPDLNAFCSETYAPLS